MNKRLTALVAEHYKKGHKIMVLSRSRSTLSGVTQKLSGILQPAKRDEHSRSHFWGGSSTMVTQGDELAALRLHHDLEV